MKVCQRIDVAPQSGDTWQIQFDRSRLAMAHPRLRAESRNECSPWHCRVQGCSRAGGVGDERMPDFRRRSERGSKFGRGQGGQVRGERGKAAAWPARRRVLGAG